MSVSTPLNVEKQLRIPDEPHHVRSHSFTPRRPSKLSVSKSPGRKGSVPPEQNIARDIANMKAHQAMPPPSLIVEPPPEDELDLEIAQPESGGHAKRSSQIVYNAGFVNRLAELPVVPRPYQAANLALAKGWKPFKMELKGSKLFFYKPPNDRATAVRDLFPTELVSAADEHEEEQEKPADGLLPEARKRPEGAPRKKRAYWGRGTHPELHFTDAGVEKGSFEALVHETVFATTILKEGSGETEQSQWRDFASSILLCLPPLVGRAKFESEFTRCSAYIVTGGTVEDAPARVTWLAGEYIRYHGAPAEVSEWEEWRAETIPNFPAQLPSNPATGMATSSSVQAIFSKSPQLGSDLSPAPKDTHAFSPNIGAFSPRPDLDGKMTSLMEALAAPPPSSTSPISGSPIHRLPGSGDNGNLWAALDREGLSREVLLVLDPYLVARTLGLFHRAALQEVPENLTAEYIINADTTSSKSDQRISTVFVADTNEAPTNPTPAVLFGSDKSPHWLTKILLMQILGVDTSTGSLAASPSQSQILSPHRLSVDRSVQTTSRTHSRSEVISAWARVGEICRLGGDECSWRAIAAALCSPPVARLDKAWKRVSADALSIVDSWVHPGVDRECANVLEPSLTPWGGDVKDRVNEALERSRGGGDDGWLIEAFGLVREMFEGTRTAFSLCPRRYNSSNTTMNEDDAKMVAFWGELCAGNTRVGTLGTKFLQ